MTGNFRKSEKNQIVAFDSGYIRSKSAIIDANTTIPSKKSQVFSTAADNQPSVEIHIF